MTNTSNGIGPVRRLGYEYRFGHCSGGGCVVDGAGGTGQCLAGRFGGEDPQVGHHADGHGVALPEHQPHFQADYERFSIAHLAELNAASNTLKADLSRRQGAVGAKRALDQISTGMANAYGNGHPWLDCAGLKDVANRLASDRQPGVLLAAADEYLGSGSGRVTLAAGH